MFAGGIRKKISGDACRCCSLNAQQISVSARYRLKLEIPRNPTVVLFLKIPRVLCSHPLTGGPGFISVEPPRINPVAFADSPGISAPERLRG